MATKKEELQTQQQINAALQQELALLESRNAVLGQFKTAQEKSAAEAQIRLSFIEKEQRLLAKQYAETLAVLEEEKEVQGDLVEELQEELNKLAESIKLLDQKAAKQEKILALQKEIANLSKTMEDSATNIAQQFGIMAAETDPIAKGFREIESLLLKSKENGKKFSESLKEAATTAAKGFAKKFDLGNAFAIAANNAMELKGSIHTAQQAMGAMGLTTDQARAATAGASAEFIRAGGSMQDLADVANDLGNTSGILAQKIGPELRNQIALLGKAGISTSDQAAILNEAMIQQGMSSEQAMERLGDLVKISKDLGEPVGKAAKQFAQFGSRIKKVGPAAVKEFAKLKAISASTGVSIEKLLSISEGFTTFEDAARATQQLNLVLGTNISSVDMMNMSESERIETIRRAIQAQGGLNNLSQHQIRLLEDSIPGNLTINEIMGMGNQVNVKATDTTKDNTAALTEQEKKTRELMTAQQKMMKDLQASSLGVTNALTKLDETFGKFLDMLPNGSLMIGLFAASAINTFLKFKNVGKAAAETVSTAVGKGAEGVGKGVETLASSVGKGAESIASSAQTAAPRFGDALKSMSQTAVTVATNIGRAIGGLVGSLLTSLASGLAQALVIVSPAIVTFGTALGAAGTAAAPAIPIILAVGAAAFGIIAPLGFLVYAISKLVDSFTNMAKYSKEIIQIIKAIGIAFNPIGAIFSGIGLVIEKVGNAITNVMSVALEKVGNIINTIMEKSKVFAKSFKSIINSAMNVSISGMAGFARFATNLTETVKAINDTELPKLKEMTMLVKASVSGGSTTAGAAAPSAPVGDLIVNLTLDGQVLDSRIIKGVRKAMG
jgi:hypothetical protein